MACIMNQETHGIYLVTISRIHNANIKINFKLAKFIRFILCILTNFQKNSIYFSLFIFAAVANGFNVRGDKWNVLEGIKENVGFLKVMGIIVIVQIALTFLGGNLFACTPFGLKLWIVITILVMAMIPVDMVRKLMCFHEK